jgi:Domain of unknown function (DUF4397)
MYTRLLALFLISFSIGLSACKKNNDAPSANLTSNLNIINTSADTVNFYLNGTRLNKNSNLYPSGASGYIVVPYGAQNFQIKKIFNPVTNTVQTLFSVPLTLDTSKYYSLFLGGETSASAFSTTDDLKADTTNNTCMVRFVNASPDAGDLKLTINDTTLYSNNITFKSAGGFVMIKTGTAKKSIKVYQSGAATYLTSDSVAFAANRLYTIYSKGMLKGTGNLSFGLGALANL